MLICWCVLVYVFVYVFYSSARQQQELGQSKQFAATTSARAC